MTVMTTYGVIGWERVKLNIYLHPEFVADLLPGSPRPAA